MSDVQFTQYGEQVPPRVLPHLDFNDDGSVDVVMTALDSGEAWSVVRFLPDGTLSLFDVNGLDGMGWAQLGRNGAIKVNKGTL